MAICSFGDRPTEEFFLSGKIGKNIRWSGARSVAKRKLDMVHYAVTLFDLLSPPGNNLEKLRGKLAGYYSIRINDQWRIIFRWTELGPASVQIVDYH